ncbi:MAG: hypothetical protein PHY47_19660 [Lachnospiraceae bacterium]|nr:hypothetical protein [Lachnospiraceae bacterium]
MARRVEGRETWHRLIEWDKGQAASERLSAAILISEGFDNVDPSHPLGGKDGGKDIKCQFNGSLWIGAVYFPRGQQLFNTTKDKFIHDVIGAKKNKAKGIAFITNQELRLSERKELEEIDKIVDVRIYHLERMADIINSPKMYGIRLDYLDIEMTKEEQIAYFAGSESRMTRIEEKIDLLVNNINEKPNRTDIFSDNIDEDIRTLEAVVEDMNMLCDKVWFNRHLNLRYRVEHGKSKVDSTIWKGALDSAQKLIDKYGEENLGPYSDFEWGMLNGKLSALRWVLGDEWDMLDT